MIKNYLKIAWRNLWKNKAFSFINIISLSIGLSASFVIGMMVYYDFTFDTFHKDGDRIYRVVTDFKTPEGNFYNSGIAVPMRLAAKEELPGIDKTAYFSRWHPDKVMAGNNPEKFEGQDFTIFTEHEYFDIFQYKWLAGTKDKFSKEPNEVVLSEKRAQYYFPNISPAKIIGKSLTYNDSINVIIKGVVANYDQRTDIVFEEFISLNTATQIANSKNSIKGDWNSTNSSNQLYVKLVPDAKTDAIFTQLQQIANEQQSEESTQFGQTRDFHLQPLSDIHFNQNYGIYDYSQDQANKEILIGLVIIAIFLLLLGCVNFINLNTAQATKRIKEIGIRKTLGGSRKQLITQFLGETFILTTIATLVSIVLSAWLLQVFKDFIPDQLDLNLLSNPILITGIILLLIIITLLSGFYPSLVLSRYKPVSVLKGQEVNTDGKGSLRKFLTVFQFTIAQVFIIATLLVSKQLYFLMSKDMGFKTDAIAYIQTPWRDAAITKKEVFKSAIQTIPGIENVSLGGSPPASFNTHSNRMQFLDGDKDIRIDVESIYGDEHYLDLYNIKLLAGRKPLNDTINEYVINQTALQKFGYQNPEEIIGKSLKVNDKNMQIVGVMNDFNQRSLKTSVQPMVFEGDLNRSWHSQYKNVHITLPPGNTESWKKTIASIEDTFKNIYPDAVFSIRFMDETVARFYKREQQISGLLNWATGLSVLISCLGLLGLVIHTTERRTKEIGIRKILGASLTQLNVLLCKDFLILVGIAFVIAVPLAYWGLNSWLQDFAYKTTMSWWVFILSGVVMVMIALIIMSIRTISTAMKNPVKSLKTE